MAMYQQAAVSKQQDNTFSSVVMEESEVCSVPGGLASVRAQFENQETAPSHNVSQFHFHRRAVQEVQLNSEVTMRSSSREVIPASQQAIFHQDEQVTHEENNFTSVYDNKHNDEREEEGPRFTTKELRDHFERTIEEAAPSKPMKTRVPKSELCTVCRRRVYPMEALIADRKKFHKSCFCCEHCRNKLSLGNYVSLHGHLYCLPHYKQLFKSKGNYDNRFGQTLHNEKNVNESGRLITSSEQLDWRYSRSSIGTTEKDTLEKEFMKSIDENKLNCNKISVVWPPQAHSPQKAFKVEEDIKLTKPHWPPQDNSPKSPKQQHRKAISRSSL
nr:xin actin-binding repeat-containing protein 2-like isoform X2 [Salvelinus alpinus]